MCFFKVVMLSISEKNHNYLAGLAGMAKTRDLFNLYGLN